jgi:hypothetical protein
MFAHLCNTTADIKRPTFTTGTVPGQKVSSTATPYDDIAVSIQPAKAGTVAIDQNQRQVHVSHNAYTPQVITLQQGDYLVSDSVTYLIVGWGNMAGRNEGTKINLVRKD